MRIGFDAKRAFLNSSGLGNYSRSTLALLSHYYPENEYFLYTPKESRRMHDILSGRMKVVAPSGFPAKSFPWLWRSFLLSGDLKKNKLDVFHGLSNELPANIQRLKLKSVVTIHDVIFKRYPEFYKPFDRKVYTAKTRYACEKSDRIIAVSKQTREDLVHYFGIDEKKVSVVYQGCKPIFSALVRRDMKDQVRRRYNLPEKFLLYVGNIEARKNVLSIIQGLEKGKLRIPLVIVGRPTPYLEVLNAFITEKKIRDVIFYHEVPDHDLPAFYQMATIFIYPSLFEGFGIPVLEALTSGVPVITSRGGCFSEPGGESTIYINPHNPGEFADAIKTVWSNESLQQKMINDGYKHAMNFHDNIIARNLMDVYDSLLEN